MQDISNQALDMISNGKLEQALEVAHRAVKENPNNCHAHYALGQCFRLSGEFEKSVTALMRACELNANNAPYHQALAVALQKLGALDDSVAASFRAHEIDPWIVEVYNTLAVTRQLMGNYEFALGNYESALEALSHNIFQRFENISENREYRHPPATRQNLWVELATECATGAALNDGLDGVAMPNSEIAESFAQTGDTKGLYWQDFANEGITTRLLLPNFFHTFAAEFFLGGIYTIIRRNISYVYDLIGDFERSNENLIEAEDFTPAE